MGSALFPLFEVFFSYEDNDVPEDSTTSSEIAWRTVFVVPTIVSLLTAYAIVYHADDSPKGKSDIVFAACRANPEQLLIIPYPFETTRGLPRTCSTARDHGCKPSSLALRSLPKLERVDPACPVCVLFRSRGDDDERHSSLLQG